MRKIKYAIVWILMPILLGSCFSDDGNYKYESLKPPTWLIDVSSKPIQIVGRGGSNTKIDASKVFNWGNLDSLQRSQEVRYEWRYNGKPVFRLKQKRQFFFIRRLQMGIL